MAWITERMNFSIRIGFILIGVLFLLAACNDTNPRHTGTLEQVTIGIASTYQGEAATYVALDRGYFEENGLDVTLKQNPSGRASLRDLFMGDVQIAHVAETPVVYSVMDTSYFSGTSAPPFQIFADMIYSNRIQKIIGRKDSGISEPVDIVGKKVGLLEGTQLDYFFDSFLLEHQISNDEFEILDLNPSQQYKAIKSGEIDVAVLWEPYASYTQKELGDNATVLNTDLTYSTLWLSATLDSYAVSHPEILVAYLESLRMAHEYIHDNPEYTQKLLAKKIGAPLDVVQSLWTEIDFELSISERMLTLLEEQARWMFRKNIADSTIQNMQHLINFTPMEQVYPRGITVVR